MTNPNVNQTKPLSECTPDELKTELQDAVKKEDDERIQEVSTEIVKRKKSKLERPELNETQEKMLEKMAAGKAKIAEIKQFVSNDLKNWKSKTSEWMKNIEDSNAQKIEDLQKQLDDKTEEAESLKKTLTTLPSIKEYLSLKTRGMIHLANKIDDLKENKNNGYPKNVLIYCIAATQIRLFGTRAMVKRGRVKMRWKRKDTEIVNELNKTKQRLTQGMNNDGSTSKNSKEKNRKTYTSTLKSMILEKINIAQKDYYEQLKGKIVG